MTLLTMILASPAIVRAPAGSDTRNKIEPASQDTLTSPPVLVNTSSAPHTVEVTLIAEVKRLSIRPGTTTEVFAYNGTIPGPTLEMHEGDRVTVHFQNKLPEQTTIHWHGLHVPITSDGSPFYPIKPGGAKDYVFTVPRGTAL